MKRGNRYTEIIGFFIKEESLEQNKKVPYFWAREVKIVKSLLQTYPEQEFWRTLGLDFKLNSMAFWKTQDGEKILSLKYKMFKMDAQPKIQQIEISDQKFGEDIEIKKNKNKSVKDFFLT